MMDATDWDRTAAVVFWTVLALAGLWGAHEIVELLTRSGS